MDALALEPGMDVDGRALDLYDRITVPAVRLGRWAMRRRRAVGDMELQGIAHGMLAAFEEFLAAPPLMLETTVRKAEEPAPDEAEAVSGLNVLLDLLRSCRHQATGAAGDALVRALRARQPDLAKLYEATRSDFLERLAELERMLVLFGAGSEADAGLGMDLIPVPADLPPGPSVYFEL
jgi:hypothetical protein